MTNISVDDTSSGVRDVVEFLKAISGETRLRILLTFLGGEALSVGEVARRLRIGQSTASEGLAVLKRAGILHARREGKSVFYRPDRERALGLVDTLRRYLETCCGR